jgi:hypothetical protein
VDHAADVFAVEAGVKPDTASSPNTVTAGGCLIGWAISSSIRAASCAGRSVFVGLSMHFERPLAMLVPALEMVGAEGEKQDDRNRHADSEEQDRAHSGLRTKASPHNAAWPGLFRTPAAAAMVAA